jgi:hypothetical protein
MPQKRRTALLLARLLMIVPAPWVLLWAAGIVPVWTVGVSLSLQLAGFLHDRAVERRQASAYSPRHSAATGLAQGGADFGCVPR